MLKKIAKWLFSSKTPPKSPSNPFAIIVGEGDDPDLRILAKPRVRYPRKKGRTEEEFQADLAVYAEKIRVKADASFRLTKRRAESVGSTGYTWRSARDSDVCPDCKERDGKRFKWDVEPKHGHAGVATCCPQGWCRCYPEPIIRS